MTEPSDALGRQILTLPVAYLNESEFIPSSEPDLIRRVKTRVPEPSALENDFGRNGVSILIGARDRDEHLFLQLRGHSLVRVQVQNPLVLKSPLSQSEIALLGEVDKAVLQDAGAPAPGDVQSAVCAERVQDQYVVRPRDGVHAGREIVLLVEGEDENRDHSSIFLCFTKRAGLPTTTVHGAPSRSTTALAPTTAPAPTTSPGPTKAAAPTQAWSPIEIGGLSKGRSGWR